MNIVRKAQLLAVLVTGFIAPQTWAQAVVPFKVQIEGGMCDSAGAGTSNPEIEIDNTSASGTFLVNSILFKTDSVPISGTATLSLNSVTIDGTLFDTRTASLVGPVSGTGVQHSADVLGTPVRISGSDYSPGGNVPHDIAASSAGASDIVARFFCSMELEDLNITDIVVAGWKRAGDVITVTYIPGS